MKKLLCLLLFASPLVAQQINPSQIKSGVLGGDVSAPSMNGAINAALLPGLDIGDAITTKLAPAPVGTVEIPDGTYSFSHTISITQNQFQTVTIHCNSRNAVLNYTGTGDAFYITSQMNSAAQVTIENCSIFGGSAGPTANGIHLFDSQNVRLRNVMVYNFKGTGLLGVGSIDLQSYGSDYSTSGLWNVELAPDPDNQFASNANHFYGGSMQYGGSGNFWDAGDYSAYGGNTNNTLDGVTLELSANAPQFLIEGTKNDAISNCYIEYINFATATGDLYAGILGNYAGSGYGSNLDFPAVGFRFIGNYMIMPTAAAGHTDAALLLANTNYLDIQGMFEDGNPTYAISFYASGTNTFDKIEALNVGYATSIYQNPVAAHNRLWWPVDAAPALGQFNIDVNGYNHFGGVVSTTDVTATASFKNSHGTIIPSTVTGPHGSSGTKLQLSDGTGVSGNCAKFGSDGSIVDSGAACTGGTGGGDFGSLAGGTNTSAVMAVGTGASLGPSGTGLVTANGLTGSPAITVASCVGCRFGNSGSVTYTGNTTASASDEGLLVKMQCASACTYTLPATQPSTSWRAVVISTGAGAATIVIGGSDTFNGGTVAPPLPALVWANTNLSTAYLGISAYTGGIPNIQISTNTTLIAAGTCTGETSTSMPGVVTTTAFLDPTPTIDTSAVTGWGDLKFSFHPTADHFNWRVCNKTPSDITPGSSVTWNIGAR